MRPGDPSFLSRNKHPIALRTPQQMITDALEKVITAIIHADMSEEEKNEPNLCCENCSVPKQRPKYWVRARNHWPLSISSNRARLDEAEVAVGLFRRLLLLRARQPFILLPAFGTFLSVVSA
jgi:hypothetical protein